MIRALFLTAIVLVVSSEELRFNVTNSKDNTILYTSREGLNLTYFPPQDKNVLCRQQQQFYIDTEQTFRVDANVPFTTSVRTDKRMIVANGLSRSIPDGDKHTSELVILTRCLREEISTFAYNIVLTVKSDGNESVVELPASIECLNDISSAKIEYVILQFMSSALFVLLSLTFTKFIITSYDVDILLLSMLCVCWVHQYVATAFSYLLTVRIFYSVCTYTRVRHIRRLIVSILASFLFHFGISTAEVELPLLHVFSNFVMAVGLVTIFKVSRLRIMVCVWMVVYYTYPHFNTMT